MNGYQVVGLLGYWISVDQNFKLIMSAKNGQNFERKNYK